MCNNAGKKAGKVNAAKFLSERFYKFRPICKGMSPSDKYYVETNNDRCFFVRIVDNTQSERFENEFKILQNAAQEGVSMPHPVEMGKFDCGRYMIIDWVDGETLYDALPSMTRDKQHKLGIKAGEIMRKIHSIPMINNSNEWAMCPYFKMKTNIAKYPEYAANFTDVENRLIDYIELNKELLQSYPFVLLHGDYSPMNMMLESGELKIIDFNSFGFGVPWIDMGKIISKAMGNEYFYLGLIHSYFDGEPSQDSWKLIAFYAALHRIDTFFNSAIYERSSIHIVSNNEFSGWFDDMKNFVPSWYLHADESFIR